jgi:hypothetical protein
LGQAKAFELVVGLLLALLTALSGWTLRTVLKLLSRTDRMEERSQVILHGSDGQNGLVGDIRYLRDRVGCVGRAAQAIH